MGADLYFTGKPREDQITGFRTDLDVGYFRDAYNDSNLLWQFGLDYWTWFQKHLDQSQMLTAKKAKLVKQELAKREAVFEEKLKLMDDPDDQKYFKEKYELFKNFLDLAIKSKKPIECSI